MADFNTKEEYIAYQKGWKDAAIKAIYVADFLKLAVDMLENRLTIPPEPAFVFCRDCRYWQDNNNGYPHPDCRWNRDETPDAFDFCSEGVRKVEE